LTHHWAKVDKIDEARKLLDRNGDAQSKAPGFVSRQTLIALADPAKITTLVVWTTNDIYEAWRASPQRTMAMSGADRLWAKPPEAERFQLVGKASLGGEPLPQCPEYRTRSGPLARSRWVTHALPRARGAGASPRFFDMAGCCARAASGHAAAAPPRSVMNARRFIRSPRRRAIESS